MLSETKKSLILFRLETASKSLAAAKILIDAQAYKDAANRLYYCVFHAMRAVLAIDGFDSKKHSGVISAFRQKYMKTGIFQLAKNRFLWLLVLMLSATITAHIIEGFWLNGMVSLRSTSRSPGGVPVAPLILNVTV